MKQKFLLLLCGVIGLSVFLGEDGVVQARSKYLDESIMTATKEKVVKGLVQVARNLAAEKEHKKQVKLARREQKKREKQARLQREEQERQLKAEMAKIAKEAKARKKKEMALLRKASLIEARRRKRLITWRDFNSNKKAASCLIKAVDAVDLANQVHVEELQREIRMFGDERLEGNLSKYPDLEGFLDL